MHQVGICHCIVTVSSSQTRLLLERRGTSGAEGAYQLIDSVGVAIVYEQGAEETLEVEALVEALL